MNDKIFLLTGKAGVGKSSAKDIIIESLKNKRVMTHWLAFAKMVKYHASEMGWDGKKDDKGRAILQGMGQLGRAYDEDMWVNSTLSNVSMALGSYVIDDCRFPNEIETTKKYADENNMEVITVRVKAPNRETLKNNPVAYHEASETSLDHMLDGEFDFILDSRGSLKELAVNVDLMLAEIYPDLFNLADIQLKALGY